MSSRGEIATVLDGEYFDADISGEVIHTYSKGSIVIYGAFSTHRPLSKTGGIVSYTTLDGIIFPGNSIEIQAEDPLELLKKMESKGAPQGALEYAKYWMQVS